MIEHIEAKPTEKQNKLYVSTIPFLFIFVEQQ